MPGGIVGSADAHHLSASRSRHQTEGSCIQVANFGVEGIRYFPHARAAGVATVSDFTYAFNITNGIGAKLQSAGHNWSFYYTNTSCWETDVRDDAKGGSDDSYADKVDLFFIMTHGGHQSDGQARMLYDTAQTQWRTYSGQWALGENLTGAEWVMAYSCETVDGSHLGGLWNIFQGLHMYCGAYDLMWDGPTTEECGRDVGQNLIDGHTVAWSWIDGVSDWAVDNHPAVVCVSTPAAWNNGNVLWNQTHIGVDHYWGHGSVLPDLPPNQQGCILWQWATG
jgi:hypothetical protein